MEVPDSDPLLWSPELLINIFTGQFTPGVFFSLLIILFLLFFSALISGSEIAFFSLNPNELKDIEAKNTRVNKFILTLLETPKRLLATILISNNFVNVGIVMLSAFVSGTLFDFSQTPILGFIIEVIVITTFLLLFGEIMPKIFANNRPVVFAAFMAQPLFFLMKVFYTLSKLLVRTTKFIDMTASEWTPEEETKILKGIVKFTEIEVKEIMKSRMDVISLDSASIFDDMLKIVRDSGYSRIPVFTETFDKIDGILYVKDLLPHLDQKNDFNWTALLRPAFFVPENKKINDLLQEIQEKKIHMAIVVDEYGGTSGIVTLEDIIEEIVGEISDEFDTPEDEIGFTKIDDKHFVFEGKTSINDFCKIINADNKVFDEVKGDADSIAGLILEILGKIPERNTVITYLNFEFKVLSVDKRRIKMVNVTIEDKIILNDK